MNVCVFCSSSDAVHVAYDDAAAALGEALGGAGHTLVYGGTDIGLMGTLAHATRGAGGRVVGILPQLFLERGIEDRHADDLVVTDGMMARKQAMEERADGFIVLPGGFGTLDEALEMITLRQLGFHGKPIVFLDVADPEAGPGDTGFWQPLLDLFERLYDTGFAKPAHRGLFHVASSPAEALRLLAEDEPEDVPAKWF